MIGGVTCCCVLAGFEHPMLCSMQTRIRLFSVREATGDSEADLGHGPDTPEKMNLPGRATVLASGKGRPGQRLQCSILPNTPPPRF